MRLSRQSACTQGAQDGSLGFLVSKVRSQPQVYTAYHNSAPMRSKEATAEFEAAVLPLKVSKAIFHACLLLISSCFLS